MSSGINSLTFDPKHEQVLRQQVIDDQQPGTLLHDFQVLLDFIGPGGLEVGGKKALFPMKHLGELNARLARPLAVRLRRPQLRSYPNIQGLYLLLRATGLGITHSQGAKLRLMLNEPVLQSWNTLNPTERYFNLLEAWLVRGHTEMIGVRGGIWSERMLPKALMTFTEIPAKGMNITDTRTNNRPYVLMYDAHHVGLLWLFGLLDVEQRQAPPEGPWLPAAIRRTEFGRALLGLLNDRTDRGLSALLEHFGVESDRDEDAADQAEDHEEQDDGEDNGELAGEGPEESPVDQQDQADEENEMAEGDDEEEVADLSPAPFGQLQPIIQPYFPQWQNNLTVPEIAFRDGVWVFKVSLPRVWRRIAIPAALTLENLTYAILGAYRFDSDHMYQFTFQDPFGAEVKIDSPHDPEGPATTEVLIGQLPLAPGQSMTFVYDFGDNWEFNVKLERIDPPKAQMKRPRVLEKSGKAPKQYQDYW